MKNINPNEEYPSYSEIGTNYHWKWLEEKNYLIIGISNLFLEG